MAGRGGMLAAPPAAATWIDMTSSSPAVGRVLFYAAHARGIGVLEAPAAGTAPPGGGARRGRDPPEPAAARTGQPDAAHGSPADSRTGEEPAGHRLRRDRGDPLDTFPRPFRRESYWIPCPETVGTSSGDFSGAFESLGLGLLPQHLPSLPCVTRERDIRIPTLAVSAYIDPSTVVTSGYRNTSLIRTLRERWPLGPPLTARDATAPDIAAVLTRATPRAQEDWPEVTPRPVPQLPGTLLPPDKRLPPLGRYLLGVAIALDTKYTGHVPDLDPKTATGQQADDYMNDRTARIWPVPGGRRGRGLADLRRALERHAMAAGPDDEHRPPGRAPAWRLRERPGRRLGRRQHEQHRRRKPRHPRRALERHGVDHHPDAGRGQRRQAGIAA
jgi:hypothetical protein